MNELEPSRPAWHRGRRRGWVSVVWVLGAICVAVPVLVATFGGHGTSGNAGSKTVVYSVTSDAGAATVISYSTGGGIGQQANAYLPWSYTIPGASGAVSVNAQGGQYASWISCSITEDGSVIDSQRSTGQYAVVSCTARVG